MFEELVLLWYFRLAIFVAIMSPLLIGLAYVYR